MARVRKNKISRKELQARGSRKNRRSSKNLYTRDKHGVRLMNRK